MAMEAVVLCYLDGPGTACKHGQFPGSEAPALMVSSDFVGVESCFFDGFFAKPWHFSFKQPKASPLAL